MPSFRLPAFGDTKSDIAEERHNAFQRAIVHIWFHHKKVHDFLTVGAPAPLQKAALVGLAFEDRYYEWLLGEYDRKRRLLVDGLREIGLSCVDPQGAYYVLVDISGINRFATDVEFCEWLVREIGVGAVPASSFFKEPVHNYIRFHFAKRDDVLVAALERMKRLKELL
jgi:aminotransferase